MQGLRFSPGFDAVSAISEDFLSRTLKPFLSTLCILLGTLQRLLHTTLVLFLGVAPTGLGASFPQADNRTKDEEEEHEEA
jgi:hypothetical protein